MPATAPQRIVSLCPSITETLHALGAWPALVGRTRYCVHPEGLVDSIPQVGGTKRPDLSRIIALRPDLVLCNEEENRREDALALEQSGVRVVSYFPRDLRGTVEYIEALGRDVGRPLEGARLAAELETEIAREGRGGDSLRYAYLIWRKPWMAVGRDTFISRLLEAAGFQNALLGSDRYPSLTSDELRDLNADVVFLSSEPFPFTEQHSVELAEATGMPAERFLPVDGQLLSWHGSRTVVGLRYARELALGLA